MHRFILNRLNRVIGVALLLCLPGFALQAQKFELQYNRKKAVLPFQFIKNLIIIPLEINGRGPYNFVLDTGVGFCIITDPSLLDTLHLGTLRTIQISGFGEGEDLTAHVIPSLNINIGKTQASSVAAAVLQEDAFNLSSFTGMPVYGLIGYDFFNSFIVRINYVTNQITMYRSHGSLSLRNRMRLPLQVEERKPYIHSELALPGRKPVKAKLIIDTGSGHPLSLETDSGKPFELPEKHIPANLGIGISGPINGALGRIDYLKLGKYEIRDVLTAFPNYADAGAKKILIDRSGSLGNGILRRFDVVFDYPHSALYLKPTSSLKTPFEHDMSGMELYSSGESYKRLFVLRVEDDSAASEAGISPDDEILAINLKPVAELDRDEIDALFKSKDDRSFIIDLVSPGSLKLKRTILTLKRRI